MEKAVTMPENLFPVLLTVEDTENISSFVGKMGQQLDESRDHAVFSFVDITHEYDLTADLIFAYQGEGFVETKSGGEKSAFYDA